MSNISISLNLVENQNEIAKGLNKALLSEINSRLPRVFRKSEKYIKSTVMSAIRNQPEYGALVSGELKDEFGLTNARGKVDAILLTLEDSLYARYKKPFIKGNFINGGFTISMINAGFSDILSMPEAIQMTEKGVPLEWLKWLLLQGDTTIISGYEFKIGGKNSKSRTGGGIMSASVSGSWRVPPDYSGTMSDNWLTRAINSVSDDIEANLKALMQKM